MYLFEKNQPHYTIRLVGKLVTLIMALMKSVTKPTLFRLIE